MTVPLAVLKQGHYYFCTEVVGCCSAEPKCSASEEHPAADDLVHLRCNCRLIPASARYADRDALSDSRGY